MDEHYFMQQGICYTLSGGSKVEIYFAPFICDSLPDKVESTFYVL